MHLPKGMENSNDTYARGGARPKRVKHPPAWLEGFEVDYSGHCHQTAPPQHDATPSQGFIERWHPARGRHARITLHSQSHAHAATSPVQRDAARSEMTQLAPDPPGVRTHDERQRGQRPLHQSLLGTDRAELRAFREENVRLIETQKAIHKALLELCAIQAEMRELFRSAHSLCTEPISTPLHSVRAPTTIPTVAPPVQSISSPYLSREQLEVETEGEEDWPEPPPWPGNVARSRVRF